jgi:uroporphyrin-III C-methyltransferase/precorrin-2 dehydrogenase/sirohydrochlorin ferrochelatase
MDFLPIFLNVRGRTTVVVGGGPVAARKAELLVRSGALVTVVAPQLSPAFDALRAAGRIEHRAERFVPAALTGACAVIAATDQPDDQRSGREAARAHGIPVNVVDDLGSTFISRRSDRDPVIVAVGTSGNAPVLARHVRERIEALLPPQLGRLASLAGRWRRRIAKTLRSALARRRFWERVFSGPIATHALAGRDAQAEFELRRELKRAQGAQTGGVGEVYIVGAGPGDPDLLTLKAARLLQQADVVLFDRLIPEAVLDRARRDAERIYVGKEAGNHHVTQEQTHALMIELARQGKRVCRLKGGDPFVFGRGGEEVQALIENQIPFTVVPGITAALGAAAYAGIPLTHRDHAQSVTFVTGHTREGGDAPNWRELARPGQTIVFYMGLSQLQSIVEQLTAAGASPALPAAIIECATLPEQRVIVATLDTLSAKAAAAKVHSPALLIVGDVVALRVAADAQDAQRSASSSSSLPLGEGRGEGSPLPTPIRARRA